jgi:hypothetical protein
MKTATVTNIQENVSQFDWQGKKYHKHTITFDNGDKGEYTSVSPTCDKFKVMEQTTYTIETKTNGQYTNVVIKPVQAAGSGGFKKSEPKDQGIITALSCLSSASNLYTQTMGNSPDNVIKAAEIFYQWAISKSTLNK